MKEGIFAGVDVGAGTAKAVILSNDKILAYAVTPTGFDAAAAALRVTRRALRRAGLKLSEVKYAVSTGYGREIVPFSNRTVTEITCHARGASFLFPECRTVIDIGCQDSKAIRLDERGRVMQFVMNDKCAAGTGRFIEVIAHTLRLKIEEIGPVALTSQSPCAISSTCTVFAESEVVSLRGRGRKREDLIAGVLQALAKRVSIQANSVRPAPVVVFTGGVAKNIGMKQALEKELGFKLSLPEEPQVVGALGAALFAQDESRKE